MLTHNKVYPRPDLTGFSEFHMKCLFSYKSTRNAFDLNGIKRIHSQLENKVEGGQKASRNLKLSTSSRFFETMGRNMIIEESMQNSQYSSTYDMAMEALSSLISRKKRGDKSNVGGKYDKLDRMSMYIKILGLEEHIVDLKIIHVAGTKGKGSTCAFCESILRECGFRTGLFTSPHLIDVRERFRLDGLDISEEKFLHYFWVCWYQLKENVSDDLPMPPLFQFLTVLALKIFACEKVDVAVIEVGLGGTRDSTNVIKCPVVCGVTPLGMDHVEILGNTLGQIASHKAGIFKPRVPAFTVPQLTEAMDVLQEKANELMVPFEVVSPLDHNKLNGVKLSLSGEHQYTNAGLAVALCKSWLDSTGNIEKLKHAELDKNSPDAFLRGLSTARLSGRAQIVHDLPYSNAFQLSRNYSGDLIFHLDGAHSPESIEACGKWFSSAVKEENNSKNNSKVVSGNGYVESHESEKISEQILLFNCMDVRDPKILLPTLVDTCASSGTYFSKAIFVPSISTYNRVTSGYSSIPLDVGSKDLTWQLNLQRVWENIVRENDVSKRFESEHSVMSNFNASDERFSCSSVVSSLPLTINWLRNYAKQNPSSRIQVLVTGSLHLVGDVLKLLRR